MEPWTCELLDSTCTVTPVEPCGMGGFVESNTIVYSDSIDPDLRRAIVIHTPFHNCEVALAPSYVDVNLAHYHAKPPST